VSPKGAEGKPQEPREEPSVGAGAIGGEAESKEASATPPADEDVWKEDYEEHIDAEPEPEPRPRKGRGKGRMSALVAVAALVLLVAWTLASPGIVPESGEIYTSSSHYANLGSYIGWRQSWAANTTWGISVGGGNATRVGEALNISVLVTKVEERTGNWFMRGSAISLRNVSAFTDDGVFVGEMSNWTDVGFGQMATVPLVFSEPGMYSLYLHVRFMVYIDMRLGFLPVEAIDVGQVYLDVPVSVT